MANSVILSDEAIFSEIFKHIDSDFQYLEGIDNADDIMELFAKKYKTLKNPNPLFMEIVKKIIPEDFI